jgi:C4-dicarboxylate-specific signal transduction histidine kinase
MYIQDIFNHTLQALAPSSSDGQHGRKSAMRGAQQELSAEGSTAGLGTAEAGVSYPVTCRARYYDAASRILEDDLHLYSHDNCNELGKLIQQWVERKHDNWEPR